MRAQSNQPTKPTDQPAETDNKQMDTTKRSDVKVLGKTDSASGESRHNENVQFNLIDNTWLKEAHCPKNANVD